MIESAYHEFMMKHMYVYTGVFNFSTCIGNSACATELYFILDHGVYIYMWCPRQVYYTYVVFYEHSVINSTSDLFIFVRLYIFLVTCPCPVTFTAKSHVLDKKRILALLV
jgi:hypothetical protein